MAMQFFILLDRKFNFSLLALSFPCCVVPYAAIKRYLLNAGMLLIELLEAGLVVV